MNDFRCLTTLSLCLYLKITIVSPVFNFNLHTLTVFMFIDKIRQFYAQIEVFVIFSETTGAIEKNVIHYFFIILCTNWHHISDRPTWQNMVKCDNFGGAKKCVNLRKTWQNVSHFSLQFSGACKNNEFWQWVQFDFQFIYLPSKVILFL